MKTKMIQSVCCIAMVALLLFGSAMGRGGSRMVAPQCDNDDVLVLQ